MERNTIIDILKGIGICFVLSAHTLEGGLSKFAYTFHIPLFLIVSGLFIRQIDRDTYLAIKKNAKRLLIPAILTIGVITCISCVNYYYPASYMQDPISLISNILYRLPGNLWFLFALFWGKLIFIILTKYIDSLTYLTICCVVIGYSAFLLSDYVCLPLDIMCGFSILPFIVIGYYMQRRDCIHNGFQKWAYLSIPIWITYIFYGNLRVGQIIYSWGYLPDILAAVGGTLFFYLIAKYITYVSFLSILFQYLGKNSIVLICAPTIETYCFPFQIILPDMPCRFIFILLFKCLWCLFAIEFVKRITKVIPCQKCLQE